MFFSSPAAHFTAASGVPPWIALAYMSVMMYLVSASAALRSDGPAWPGVSPRRPATRYGAITGSSSHILCFSQTGVGGVAKPFCETNHFS
jgi:hypothetical protein